MALKRTAHKNILFSFAFILTLLIRYLIYLIYLSYQLRKNESERKQTIIGQILSDIDIFKAPQAWPKPEVIYGDLLHKVVLNVGVKVSQLLIQFSAISADSETKPQTFSSLRNNKTNARAETAAGSVAILTQYCSIAYFYTEAYFPTVFPHQHLLAHLLLGMKGENTLNVVAFDFMVVFLWVWCTTPHIICDFWKQVKMPSLLTSLIESLALAVRIQTWSFWLFFLCCCWKSESIHQCPDRQKDLINWSQ